MITSAIIEKVFCRKKSKHHLRAVLLVGLATAVLIIVGRLLSSDKTVEYGTLWLFEQFLGGAKAAFFGAPEE